MAPGCNCDSSDSTFGDGGTDAGEDPYCGDGWLHESEVCDPGIEHGMPGACPTLTDCDDQLACTHDSVKATPMFVCDAVCAHDPISTTAANDGCCPSGATNATDNDCSASCGDGVVDTGESCDTGIASGPGSCPASCNDGMSCTTDTLLSAGTCNAQCSAEPITATVNGDGCCPSGANSATDNDCSVSCGNGIVESGESCDTTIAQGNPGACPTGCNDNIACTSDALLSSGTCNAACTYTPIVAPANSDMCCPAGANSSNDNDCSASCGNGIVESGESCDTTIAQGSPGACPVSCDDGVTCTTDSLVSGGTCNATCSHVAIVAPTNGDSCCPAGANSTNDNDCSVSCGNGVVESGETCDTAISQGSAGACPANCNDNMVCTGDSLVSAGTCNAACSNLPIVSPANNDGCCPTGGNNTNDNDCAVTCGNGVVENGESCDTAIASGTGSCPSSCGDGNVCTSDMLLSSGTCMAACVNTTITAPANGDGCCPAGATLANDADCPVACGDGVKSNGEACDTAIPSGNPGACPTACNDGINCTTDSLSGGGTCAAMCTTTPITTPTNGDMCCPSGATMANDTDCATVCGDGAVTGGEACDTAIASGPGSCPTPVSCNDGVACTSDTIVGSACAAACTHAPIAAGPTDSCCPAGANIGTDADCPVMCGDAIKSPSEACDTALVYPAPGSCPTVASCNDNMVCTTDSVGNSGTCQAVCAHGAITTPSNGDMCCPSGATAGNDSDCPAVCGDGFRSPTESCDDGNMSTGDGCNYPTCVPTCTADSQCDDNNVCTLASTCSAAGANGARSCTTASPAPMTTTCSPPVGGMCDGMGACAAGGPVCGNGTLESGEICDDGNSTRWDGCFGCQYEQVLRVTQLSILNSTPAACATLPHKTGTSFNVIGPALDHDAAGMNALTMTNDGMATGVSNGSFITLVHPLDLDATVAARLGQNDSSIRLAFFQGGYTGAFDSAPGAPFQIVNSGTQLSGAALDPSATRILAPGSILSSVMTGGSGTGTTTIMVDLGGGPVPLQLNNVLTNASLANDTTRITNATSGVICGTITGSDLDKMATAGQVASYCGNRSLLDVIGLGCNFLWYTIVSSTQPNVDLGGDGFPTSTEYIASSGDQVNVCRDSSSNTRIPSGSGTDVNCAQNAAMDDGYGVALSYTAQWVRFSGTRTGP